MAGRGGLVSTPEKVWKWDPQRAMQLGLAGPKADQRILRFTAAREWVVATEPMVRLIEAILLVQIACNPVVHQIACRY